MDSAIAKSFDACEDETMSCGNKKDSAQLRVETSRMASVTNLAEDVCNNARPNREQEREFQRSFRAEDMQQSFSKENTLNSSNGDRLEDVSDRFCNRPHASNSNSGSAAENETIDSKGSKMDVDGLHDLGNSTAVTSSDNLNKDPPINTCDMPCASSPNSGIMTENETIDSKASKMDVDGLHDPGNSTAAASSDNLNKDPPINTCDMPCASSLNSGSVTENETIDSKATKMDVDRLHDLGNSTAAPSSDNLNKDPLINTCDMPCASSPNSGIVTENETIDAKASKMDVDGLHDPGNSTAAASSDNLNKDPPINTCDMPCASSLNSRSVTENETIDSKASKMDDDVQNKVKRTAELNFCKLNNDPRVNTLEDALNHFGLSTVLQELEKSLEDVKKNKNTNGDHELCLKSADKRMQKLSLTFHPDRVRSRGGSDQQVATAQKLQSALNASRTVLKILTQVFLREIDIDYRYEYFAKLQISSLVNEDAIKRQINDVLYKVNEISEIKRLKIIGEIRNFLTESQNCAKSYIESDLRDFRKSREYALYHLNKCINGYKELETECEFLIKECQDETEKNIKFVLIKVAEQIDEESRILTKLEDVARRSLEGSFQVFTTDKPLDEYFVLPFVHHVNVLLMCNAIFEKKTRRSWCSSFSLNFNGFRSAPAPHFKDDLMGDLFAKAYNLASHLKDKKRFKRKIEAMESEGFEASTDESIIKAFDETLKVIVEVLKNDFRIDAYKEGKSNRMKFMEKLSKLEKEMADLREKENNLSERIAIREKMMEEHKIKYQQDMKEN